MIIKLVTSLLQLCSLLVTCSFAEIVTGENNALSNSSDLAFSLSSSELLRLLCLSDLNDRHGYIECSYDEQHLTSGNCAIYDEDKRVLSLFPCPDFQPNVALNGYAKLLPSNLRQLKNESDMCSPLNRKGHLCSECADGFGLSVTSFGFKCVACADNWYKVPLFLVLEFAPVTLFYLIVLVFHIRITSAPMPCFIMYAQLVAISLNGFPTLLNAVKDIWKLKLDVKIMLALYGLLNLNFYVNILPPFCISSKLNPIHLSLIKYVYVFYPILLIILTWFCVELHGRNFRPLVWLWRPFHRWFVRFRRGCDAKRDILDVFNTFFLLSYDQLMFQASMLFLTRPILRIDGSGKPYVVYHSILDSKNIHEHAYYSLLIIPIILIPFVFNILPPLLLILYPVKVFRSCLSKCHLDSIVLNTFVEKMQGCYRNGLDGGRDVRSFSGLYFFFRVMVYSVAYLSQFIGKHHDHLSYLYGASIFLLITTLIMALVQPYKKAYMNYLDVLLLSILTVQSFTLSLHSTKPVMQLVVRVLLVIPFAVVVLFVIWRRLNYLVRKCKLRRAPIDVETAPSSPVTLDSCSVPQSVVQPASTGLISYGTM